MSHVLCHVSCVTCHMSHVTCNFFFFFFWQSGEAYRWRVCYQRGLPRLVFSPPNSFHHTSLLSLHSCPLQFLPNSPDSSASYHQPNLLFPDHTPLHQVPGENSQTAEVWVCWYVGSGGMFCVGVVVGLVSGYDTLHPKTPPFTLIYSPGDFSLHHNLALKVQYELMILTK